MDQHYQQLWKEIAEAESGAEAVRTLAEILADKEGRIFILRLERKNAKLCIEVLDRVSCDLYLLPSFVSSDGLVRASSTTTSEPPRSRISSSR